MKTKLYILILIATITGCASIFEGLGKTISDSAIVSLNRIKELVVLTKVYQNEKYALPSTLTELLNFAEHVDSLRAYSVIVSHNFSELKFTSYLQDSLQIDFTSFPFAADSFRVDEFSGQLTFRESDTVKNSINVSMFLTKFSYTDKSNYSHSEMSGSIEIKE